MVSGFEPLNSRSDTVILYRFGMAWAACRRPVIIFLGTRRFSCRHFRPNILKMQRIRLMVNEGLTAGNRFD
jgi:hypothetical protein